MKIVPLSEAKTNLSRYARLCRGETVIVTVKGLPAFQLVPLDGDDDLIDQLLKHNPSFQKLLEERRAERTLSAKDAARRLR